MRSLWTFPCPARGWATLLFVSLLAHVSGHAADHRNVILIMADDIGYECFGCYGSRQYATPNIDRLAREGMRFAHAYSQPLCTPSRVKIMTGLSNVRNYAAFSVLRRDQKTIGQYFQQAGYRTMIGGKWQLFGAEHYNPAFRGKGTLPAAAGFDEICLWQVDKLGDRFWNPLLQVNGENRQFKPDDYGPDIVTDRIVQFMRTNRDRPFFVYYPMILVHNPFLPTPDSTSRKSKDKQKNFEDMVAYMDKLVGRIRAEVEALGLDRQTIILFTGDNGTNKAIRSQLDGREIRGGKGRTDDTGTHVALVAWGPGVVPAGRLNEDLVDFSDFLPTTLEAVGAPVPPGLDGQSFWPQIQGRPGQPRETVFCYYNPRPEKSEPKRFVRDKRWKLYGDGSFFDVRSDELEKTPFDPQATPESRAAYVKLKQALDAMPAEGQSLLKYAPPIPR